MNAFRAAGLLAAALLSLVGCDGTLRSRVQPGGNAAISPLEEAGLQAAVNEYLHYRTRAVLSGDIRVLWQRYPELARGADPDAGVNDEARVVERYRAMKPIDANVDPSRYEPIRYEVLGGTRRAIVHGSETYLLSDYRAPGGEFKIAIDLRLASNRWDVVRTDEVTPVEWNQATPRP